MTKKIKAITEEEKNIIHMFSNVFLFAYMQYVSRNSTI